MARNYGEAGALPAPSERPLSIDAAVRAALGQRRPESKTFVNEDDTEGPRVPDVRAAMPSP